MYSFSFQVSYHFPSLSLTHTHTHTHTFHRVIQRNLVFVVGLSPRLADPETLRKTEYFGKYGKIFKVVINNHTVYNGTQVLNLLAYHASSIPYRGYLEGLCHRGYCSLKLRFDQRAYILGYHLSFLN